MNHVERSLMMLGMCMDLCGRRRAGKKVCHTAMAGVEPDRDMCAADIGQLLHAAGLPSMGFVVNGGWLPDAIQEAANNSYPVLVAYKTSPEDAHQVWGILEASWDGQTRVVGYFHSENDVDYAPDDGHHLVGEFVVLGIRVQDRIRRSLPS